MVRKMGCFLHGCDYNPDQWLDRPEILSQDIEYMKEAGINEVTLGIFSWACYEREEGVYTFDWMDKIMDSMYENGIHVILATPSAGKPPWLAKKYPQVMRVREDRVRLRYGDRENQCNSSEIFREKVTKMDELLVQRYGNHPALIMWHVSNELYGICHCEKCQQNFRLWLQHKYKTIDNLNIQYNGAFWSHIYCDWNELESPSTIGDQSLHALALDYQRFYSELSIDLVNMEKKTIQKYCKDIPITTNMHNLNCGVNYSELAKILDVTCWDSYPKWHCGNNKESEWEQAVSESFHYDFCRSLKKKPFYLMESTPSNTNWSDACKLKRPGMHLLSSMQAVACGSDSVQYFQWRKSRGAFEKFHGAVIGHSGTNDTRVFQDVCEVGSKLKEIKEIQGATTDSKVAIIYDWDNLRALEEQRSLKNNGKDFEKMIFEYYEALLKNYVSVDIISQCDDFSSYQLVVAPALYLFKPDTPKRIRSYIENGGTFVMSAYSGLVNENDLVYESFSPYDLHQVFGVCVEETDALCDDEHNKIIYGGRSYRATYLCDLLRNQSATVLAEFEQDFYRGKSAVTKHIYGSGTAYYVAARMQEDFNYQFLSDVIEEHGIHRLLNSTYVDDVMIKERKKDGKKYLFLMNFSTKQRSVKVNDKEYLLHGYECNIVTLPE